MVRANPLVTLIRIVPVVRPSSASAPTRRTKRTIRPIRRSGIATVEWAMVFMARSPANGSDVAPLWLRQRCQTSIHWYEMRVRREDELNAEDARSADGETAALCNARPTHDRLMAMAARIVSISLLAALACGTAAAQQRDSNMQVSQLPYWEVGVLDPALSTLCSNGRFNERELYSFRIVFNGPIGPGVVGVAKTGWNLAALATAPNPDTHSFFSP